MILRNNNNFKSDKSYGTSYDKKLGLIYRVGRYDVWQKQRIVQLMSIMIWK